MKALAQFLSHFSRCHLEWVRFDSGVVLLLSAASLEKLCVASSTPQRTPATPHRQPSSKASPLQPRVPAHKVAPLVPGFPGLFGLLELPEFTEFTSPGPGIPLRRRRPVRRKSSWSPSCRRRRSGQRSRLVRPESSHFLTMEGWGGLARRKHSQFSPKSSGFEFLVV